MTTAPITKGTVLVVDDDPALRDALCEALVEDGYSPVSAIDGGAALEYLRSSPPPALILLDLMMPNVDGWQFRERQQRDPTLSRIPVVVLTARGDLHKVPVDADAYLAKPCHLSDLLDVVRRYAVAGRVK